MEFLQRMKFSKTNGSKILNVYVEKEIQKMTVLLSYKDKIRKKTILKQSRSCPPSFPLPAVLHGSPAGITHLGCDTR